MLGNIEMNYHNIKMNMLNISKAVSLTEWTTLKIILFNLEE